MNKTNLLLVCSQKQAEELKALLSLSANNFVITHIEKSGNEVLRKVNQVLPDIVITDYALEDMTGYDLAVKIEELKICPTIILANSFQSDNIDELKKGSLDIFCITKPINKQVLIHTTELAVRLSHKFRDMEQKVVNLQYQIEERKNVDRARGILMKKFNMDEEAAYNNLRKKAMDSGRTINDIAKTIIQLFEKFKEE
ncbi:ANTAR domain-containing response regulator [Candidatus Ruminimicrobiellum ovillum]|uniref:ANTAR domain-containing response regulator n=1 Tax=Candidatus Ruminimicrobiellum ovillum TaxID=1947927 RepID=UPI00355A2C33